MNREDLKDYRYSEKWIREQLQRYEEQKTMVYNITQNLDGMPKAQNKPNYALEKLNSELVIDIGGKQNEKI